jgi:hypothetical protein
MLKLIKTIAAVGALALMTACGGGGGGGGTTGGGGGTVVNCVSSPVSGCQYNATDTPQSAYGWWVGTRTVDTGTATAYLTVNSLNNFTFYVGDDFNGGEVSGSISVIGSTLSSVSGNGFDNTAGNFPSVSINGGGGGVVTNNILSYTSGINYSLSNTFSMKYTYNNLGDQTLAQNVGTYTDGSGNSLVIATDGTVTASYKSNGSTVRFVMTTCTLSQPKPTTTKMKDLVLSGSDSCNINNSIGFYAYMNASNIKKMVMRMRSTADNLKPLVLQ